MSHPGKDPGRGLAALALADGSLFRGHGIGALGTAVGEICFNTAITGYQEILTDPSYAGQIITFTFPHIGNTGANAADIEAPGPAARGLILRADITRPANWRSLEHLDGWLKRHALVGIAGIDTRRLTRLLRTHGAQSGALCHQSASEGAPEAPALAAEAAAWPGLEGMDLAKQVSCRKSYDWREGVWDFAADSYTAPAPARHHVVAVDYGAKRNILRSLASHGCRVTVVPATADGAEILAHKPDGVFLSNGPGDPAATGEYAIPAIQALLKAGVPIFGICLGHQMLALALGAKTKKMLFGHRGANHPVKELSSGKVEITSQNHGFEVLAESLPEGVAATHISLFDGTLEGLEVTGKPIFSVQHHPEASPGPQDSQYLFRRFVELMEK
ncbi:MAG: glutamine-hydrolyzing carbamoyl-phosphate synthase small subunit [Alphaproteobacteria bacterium]|nr:glutamine-hydrolyzing carbamoyl-phosphate synthase small subunit [Alphaproteobacteria bacterium]